MVVVSQASKFPLPNPSLPSCPPQITSLLFEPNSLSLALMHSDSSISLYPSLSLSNVSSLPSSPQLIIPPPSRSFTFLLLNPNPNPRVLFIVAGPHQTGGKVLLRIYVLQKNNAYARAKVISSQKGIEFDHKWGVLLDINHGMSIKLAGAVNFFAVYSFSSSKIWVVGVKLVDDDGLGVKLMRCAVIECCKPIWSMSLSFGLFILGEENGVRVLNLRNLVKGKVKRVKKFGSSDQYGAKGFGMPNGIIRDGAVDRSCEEIDRHGSLNGKTHKHCQSVKQRSVKYRLDSSEQGASFVAFTCKEVEGLKSTKRPIISLKAISIQAISPKKFVILDSAGDLHILHWSVTGAGLDVTGQTRQLPPFMNVQNLAVAVLPDISSSMQTIWITDGNHSVHVITLSDVDDAKNEKSGNETEETLMQISVSEAIFIGENIRDVVPLAANGVLILGQGNLYAYANS